MATRRSTPDILGSVMDGSAVRQEIPKAIKHESLTERTQERNIQATNQSPITPIQPASQIVKTLQESQLNPIEELKEKATFNLPIQLLRHLEDKWMEIRKMTGSKQISKTLLVEIALEMAFAEFEQSPDASIFFAKLANHKTVKQ